MRKSIYVWLSLFVVFVFATVVFEQLAFASFGSDEETCANNVSNALGSCWNACEAQFPNDIPAQQSCMEDCISPGESDFITCTSQVAAQYLNKPQLELCTDARSVYSVCVNKFNACGGLEGPGCEEALENCESSSGIDQCQ